MLAVNDHFCELFGYSLPKELIGQPFLVFEKELALNAEQNSLISWLVNIKDDLVQTKDFYFTTRDNLKKSLYVTARVIANLGQTFVLAYFDDHPKIEKLLEPINLNTNSQVELSQRKAIQKEIDKREGYLSALVDIQSVLIGVSEMENSVYHKILKSLGTAADASRVYIFYNSDRSDGHRSASLEAEWCAPEITPQFENPELKNVDYDEVLPGWFEVLEGGDCVEVIVSELDQKHRVHFESQNIQILNDTAIFR